VIVLDSHVVLWLALDRSRISIHAKTAIAEARRKSEQVAVSDISLFEIAIAEKKGRVRLNASLETFLSDIESRFVVLPLTANICARAMAFPVTFPHDPADRIISATAILKAAPLITSDNEIRRSRALATIW
jgi:PIN domain nuclease of toxin-antitoxin system